MTVRRVMGIETEYGISVPGHPNANAMLTSSQVVNAYASTDVEIFNLNVVYSTTWGDYMPFEGTANGTAPTFNPNVFDGEPQYLSSKQEWSGSIDSRYTITTSGQSGLLHTHFNLTLS